MRLQEESHRHPCNAWWHIRPQKKKAVTKRGSPFPWKKVCSVEIPETPNYIKPSRWNVVRNCYQLAKSNTCFHRRKALFEAVIILGRSLVDKRGGSKIKKERK